MSSKVKVILEKSTNKLGTVGSMISVKRGYAANYLVPLGFAKMATKSNISEMEKRLDELKKIDAELKVVSNGFISQIEGLEFKITRQADKFGSLYGSFSTGDVYTFLVEKFPEITKVLTRKDVLVPPKIKTIGVYDVTLNFSGALSAIMKVAIVADEITA